MIIRSIIIICLFAVGIASADDFTDLAGRGNEAFRENDFKKALEYYHQAEVERPETPQLDYNIANALYKEQKYEEAMEKFQKSMVTEDIGVVAATQYNLGNVQYRMGDYQNSILSYQKSLELNPEDIDAKYNLELARKMLKEQMKPEEQEQEEQQQQKQEEKQEQQDEQDEQDEKEEEQQQPQDEQSEDEEESKPKPKPQDENEMTKEDAERILNALKDDEREVQKDQKRFEAKGSYRGNDW